MMHSTEISIPDSPVTTTLDIRFAETDQMGVVHHSSYVIWFEVGRVAWMKAALMPYAEVADSGYNFAVTAIHASYRASCRFGDTVQIVTRLTKLRSRQIEFSYEVRHNTDQRVLATGSSEHICVDSAGKMTKIPQTIYDRLCAGAEQLAAIGRGVAKS